MKKPLVAFTPLIKIALPAVAAAAAGLAMVGGGMQSRTASRSSRSQKPVVASVAPVAAPPSHDPLFAFSSPPPAPAAAQSAKRAVGKATVAESWAGVHPRRGHTGGALLDRLNAEVGLLGKPGLATYTCKKPVQLAALARILKAYPMPSFSGTDHQIHKKVSKTTSIKTIY
jgi:hypothetical protein